MPKSKKKSKSQQLILRAPQSGVVAVRKSRKTRKAARGSMERPLPVALYNMAANAVNKYVGTGGNVLSTIGSVAMDASSIFAQRYLKGRRGDDVALSARSIPAPVAKGTFLRGNTNGLSQGAIAIKQTPDGVMVHQRVYVGELYNSIGVSPNPNLFDSTGAYSTFVGEASVASSALQYAPVFPVMCGQLTGGGAWSLTYKQQFFFPYNTECAQLAACYKFWRMEDMTIDFTTTTTTGTTGSVSISYQTRSIDEYNDGTQYPAGVSNSLTAMSQGANFVSTPVWQSCSLKGIRPASHGFGANNGWCTTHIVNSSNVNSDKNSNQFTTAGCIVLAVNDVSASAIGYSIGYLFADYVVSFKGQHARDTATFGYGSSLPLSIQERLFSEWIELRRRELASDLKRNPTRPQVREYLLTETGSPLYNKLLKQVTNNQPRFFDTPDGEGYEVTVDELRIPQLERTVRSSTPVDLKSRSLVQQPR